MTDLETRIRDAMLAIHEKDGTPYLDDRDSAGEWAPIFASALEVILYTVATCECGWMTDKLADDFIAELGKVE